MKLTTSRLILRDLEKRDAKNMAKYANNLNISKWLLVVPYPYTLKDAKGWISRNNKKVKSTPREDYTFAIELKSEKEFIGSIGIHKIDKFQGTGEIGYWLAEPFWRQGIMSEAFEKVLEFAFKKLKLRRIDISAFSKNKASNSLIKKMGFKYEGTRIKGYRAKADGILKDENIYGLLKEDWIKNQK